MSNVAKTIGLIFGTVGLAMAGGGAWLWNNSESYVENGILTQGTVVDLVYKSDSDGSGTYAPVVEFTDRDGVSRRYHSNSSSNPASYSRGEKVDLYYMADAPEKAMIDSFTDRHLGPVVLGGMGLLFATVGGGMTFAYFRRRKIIAHLQDKGVPIEAEFQECYHDTTTKMNGRSPWRVVAQGRHPATGKIDDFRSEPIWVDLTNHLKGKRIRVLVDLADPEKHWVDLSEYISEEDAA